MILLELGPLAHEPSAAEFGAGLAGAQKRMRKKAESPSVLGSSGFEIIKQYGGEEHVRLRVIVEIPGSWCAPPPPRVRSTPSTLVAVAVSTAPRHLRSLEAQIPPEPDLEPIASPSINISNAHRTDSCAFSRCRGLEAARLAR